MTKYNRGKYYGYSDNQHKRTWVQVLDDCILVCMLLVCLLLVLNSPGVVQWWRENIFRVQAQNMESESEVEGEGEVKGKEIEKGQQK